MAMEKNEKESKITKIIEEIIKIIENLFIILASDPKKIVSKSLILAIIQQYQQLTSKTAIEMFARLSNLGKLRILI